jgi:hypothetical protein
MHRVKKRDLRLGTEPRNLRLLAGVDDVDARLGAAAGEGDGDEPPLRLLLAHGHGSSDTASVQSGQPAHSHGSSNTASVQSGQPQLSTWKARACASVSQAKHLPLQKLFNGIKLTSEKAIRANDHLEFTLPLNCYRSCAFPG